MIRVRLVGFDETMKGLIERQKRIREAVAKALHQEALAIMATSVRQVPVDTGRLRQSHYVAPPKDSPHGSTVSMGYSADYALSVHEMTEVGHAVGKAKFLEDPVKEARQGFSQRVNARAQALLRK